MIDGTIKFCDDLEVNPEDVVLLAVAYELKSPAIGQWRKPGWMQGWKNIGCVIFCINLGVLREYITHSII